MRKSDSGSIEGSRAASAAAADRRERPFSLLVVCTGNICRSPVAERLLAERLGSGVTVSSAGTHALSGNPIFPPMAELLEAAGVRAEGFRARQLTPQLLRETDLVLTMTRQHRIAVVETWPGCVRYAFMLVEFARLLGDVADAVLPDGSTQERLRAAVPLAVAQRRQVLSSPHVDDINDPYGRSVAAYLSVYREISRTVASISTKADPE